MPRRPRRRNCRHIATPTACAALLSRLVALEAALTRQVGPCGLAVAPAPLVRLSADLVNQTRALLPGRTRKAALPRVPLNAPVSHAELAVIAGQARAALAAFISAEGFDNPADPRIDIEALRKRLADRIEQIMAERVAQAAE